MARASVYRFTTRSSVHFGSHDISGVRAHVGGPAADASHELGAHAYTHGDDVAFAALRLRGSLRTRRHTSFSSGRACPSRASTAAQAIRTSSRLTPSRMPSSAANRPSRSWRDFSWHGKQRRGATQVGRRFRFSAPDPGGRATDSQGAGREWHVFSQNNLPYLILSSQPPVRFWTVSDWIRAGAGFEAHGNHARSPACAAEIIRALGWVPEERIDFAAKNIVFDISRRVVPSEVSARGFSFLGMPTSTPVVSREGSDLVVVATRVEDVPAGAHVEPDDGQRQQVIHALAAFTGLAPAPNALDSLRNDPRARDLVVQSGVILFGRSRRKPAMAFRLRRDLRERGALHPLASQEARQEAEEAERKRLKLHDYYGEPIPGKLNRNRELVEAGRTDLAPRRCRVAQALPEGRRIRRRSDGHAGPRR